MAAIRISRVAGLLLTFILTLVLAPVASAVAVQEPTETIEFTQIVQGQITDNAVQRRYQFEAQAQDVVIIRMTPDGDEAGLQTPAFQVLNGDTIIVDSTDVFTLSLAVAHAVFQLPSDGTYTLIATRREDRSNGGVGNFILSLNRAARLETGLLVNAQTSDRAEQYYVLEPTSPFTVAYTKVGGRFSPSVTISAIKNGGATDHVAELSGKFLDSGTMSLTPDSGALYLIRVGKAFFSPNEGDVQYTLIVTPPQ